MSPEYEVRLRKGAREGWHDICARDPHGATETLRFLRTTPERRVPGKVKKLRGKLQGLLQYDVNYSDRVQYWVDTENHIVWVEFAGSHP
jgi:mRNA-degrading endonuclease RelE of RelBE toxin-antitoxin system